MGEVWKSIDNYPDYQISNLGNVKSFRVYNEGKLMKPRLTKATADYLTIKLATTKGKNKHEVIHHLVAIAFVPKREEMNVVNHIDGNKLNNVATNLEWTDHAGNNKHAYKSGLRKAPSGRGKKVAQMKVEKIIEIYPSIRKASISVGASDTSIRKACLGLFKTIKGYQWKFIEE